MELFRNALFAIPVIVYPLMDDGIRIDLDPPVYPVISAFPPPRGLYVNKSLSELELEVLNPLLD